MIKFSLTKTEKTMGGVSYKIEIKSTISAFEWRFQELA